MAWNVPVRLIDDSVEIDIGLVLSKYRETLL